jgi:hypothetical protein
MNSLFRILPNNLDNISIGNNKKNLKKTDEINKHENNKNDDKNINKNDDKKEIKYWEYGNSGLKIKNFNKVMSKNLSVLYYLDKIFSEFVEQEKITIRKIFKPNYSNTFTVGSGSESSQIICSNGNVSIKLSHNKISGLYKVVETGSSTIQNVKILPEELSKLKIPDLSDILENLDNLKLIIKITNILNLFYNFDMIDDVSNPNFNLYKLISNTLEIINKYRDEDKEKKLLKSNSKTAFYIKIYDLKGKAFVIDGENNLIYYITETELDDKIIFKYYVFNIDSNWKII